MLMGKGAKKSLIAKKGAAKSSGGDEDGDEASDVPEAEEGIASGARVWVSDSLFLHSIALYWSLRMFANAFSRFDRNGNPRGSAETAS